MLTNFRAAASKIRGVFSGKAAILISLVSAIIALGSLITNLIINFWHTEDLIIYLHFPKPNQVGTTELTIDYFFFDGGKKMALIEDVGVVQLQAMGKPQGHNSHLYIELCNDPYLPGFPHRYEAMPPEKDDELTEIQKPQTPQIDRAFASFTWPKEINIDGHEVASSAVLIEPEKTRIITARYDMRRVDQNVFNILVICPVVRYFDSEGHPTVAVCQGYLSVVFPVGEPGGGGKMFGPAYRPARLLPTVDRPTCPPIS